MSMQKARVAAKRQGNVGLLFRPRQNAFRYLCREPVRVTTNWTGSIMQTSSFTHEVSAEATTVSPDAPLSAPLRKMPF